MVADLLETLANRSGFAVRVHPGKYETFEVSAAGTRGLLSLVPRRQRERRGLSLAAAAARLGVKSRNADARYERGTQVEPAGRCLLPGLANAPCGLQMAGRRLRQ